MKRQGGFTLIELVVVIVILGILAVTAAPKFLNLQSDARASSLQGLKGAMTGAAGIVYGKAAINGVETGVGAISEGTDTINLLNGYPKATKEDLELIVVGLAEDWKVISSSDDVFVSYGFKSGTDDSTCTVTYNESKSAGKAPVITAADADDC